MATLNLCGIDNIPFEDQWHIFMNKDSSPNDNRDDIIFDCSLIITSRKDEEAPGFVGSYKVNTEIILVIYERHFEIIQIGRAHV